MPLNPNPSTHITKESQGTVRERAHARLDEILNDMENKGYGGGESAIIDPTTQNVYRLTFCDFTGERKCIFCKGTGSAQIPNLQ